jgi:hypothetical protein
MDSFAKVSENSEFSENIRKAYAVFSTMFSIGKMTSKINLQHAYTAIPNGHFEKDGAGNAFHDNMLLAWCALKTTQCRTPLAYLDSGFAFQPRNAID